MIARHDLNWTRNAACADLDSEMFYPPRGHSPITHAPAQAVCNAPCPVRRHCLAYAIAFAEDKIGGIWGGLSADGVTRLATTRCQRCRYLLGRSLVAEMLLTGHQYTHCPNCHAWVEVRPEWENPRRNAAVLNRERRV